MRSDAYITNFNLTISTHFREGYAPDHFKRHLLWEAISNQQRSATHINHVQLQQSGMAPVDVALTSASEYKIPTYGSTTR